MSTNNFSYENRCIVVTDDDLEFGNVPETETIRGGNRYYPQSLIPADFKFFNVVLTSGYYEAACIDYEDKDSDWKDLLGYDYCYDPETKTEFFNDMKYRFGISEYRLRKLCHGLNPKDFEYDWKYWDAMYEKVGEYLRDEEEVKVNEYLDKLMEEYGYTEYACVARFSNGEAWYTPKKSEGREALLQAVAV